MAFSGATPCANEKPIPCGQKAQTHHKLRAKSSIEPKESFVAEDFPNTVHAVFIQKLTHWPKFKYIRASQENDLPTVDR
jgi:hypothetical protein